MKHQQLDENRSSGRILFSLVTSVFAAMAPGTLAGLLLVDIGLTFGVSVGAIGQIRSVTSIVTMIRLVILLDGYELLGVCLGNAGIAAAIVYYSLARYPT